MLSGMASTTPIGVLVARAAKALDRAFDEHLAAVGGSGAAWLVLSSLKDGEHRTQGELAAAGGGRAARRPGGPAPAGRRSPIPSTAGNAPGGCPASGTRQTAASSGWRSPRRARHC